MAYVRREAVAIDAISQSWSCLSDAQLDQRIEILREKFARRRSDTTDLRNAFAAVREAAHRQTGLRPFRVQLMGALGLYHRQIVELVTGEGKTLVAALAATLLGWQRRPVHVITINDYLAERDAELGEPLFQRCGLGCGAVVGDSPLNQRAELYRLPIVYTTQKQIVADWLRDQLSLGSIADPVSTRWRLSARKVSSGDMRSVLVPGLDVAIVDEADAVLIDEAVTPLIIAQARGEDPQAALFQRARDLAAQLKPKRHFTVQKSRRRAKLTDVGRAEIESLLKDDEHAIWQAFRRREELVEQAIAAATCYQLGQHYQIVEDRITIVDEYTGRFEHDRQWQHGLHQAIEAKHNLPVTADRDTLASLSFQRFFMQYGHLCGMTGTAADSKSELETTYGLPVRVIPTRLLVQRRRHPDMIFVTAQSKWEAVADQIEQTHKLGRPVLAGTRSIEASEWLSALLDQRGMAHQVLNAVHHAQEAQIITEAGKLGAITVATNMAGRGTDIKLGAGVAERGGLHVILTEFHTARRIDRQLMGRAGRQGDPGSAQAIVSLEDDLVLKSAPRLGAALRVRFTGRTTPLPRWTKLLFIRAQNNAGRLASRSRAAVLRHEQELDRMLPRG